MESAAAKVGSAPATPEAVMSLGESIHGPADLWNALWLSEQEHLQRLVATRRVELASIVTERWKGEIAAFGSTLAEAERLGAERQRLGPVIAAADSALETLASQAYEAKMDAILEPLVQKSVDGLGEISETLEGANSVLAWKTTFDQAFGRWSGRDPVVRAGRAYAERRSRILAKAVPEWVALISAPESTDEDLRGFQNRLDGLFADASELAALQEYQEALDLEFEKKAQANYAHAAVKCDALAAHPSDPEAVAKGVEEDALDAAQATPACEAAVNLDDAPPRLHFQLARSYLGAGRYEEAVDTLFVAAEAGHGGSLAYLADLTLDGIGGVEPDFEAAFQLYQQATDAGFQPAADVLAEFEDMTAEAVEADAEEEALTAELRKTNPELFAEADAEPLPPGNTEYVSPRLVEIVHAGDLDAVPYGENYTKAYLIEMAGIVGDVCEGQHFSKAEIDQLKASARRSIDTSLENGYASMRGFVYALGAMLKAFESGGLSQPQQPPADAVAHDEEELPLNAMKDGFALISRYPCGDPEIEDFQEHLTAYVSSQGFSQTRMMRTCVNEARPAGRYSRSDFCDCFLGILGKTHLTRGRRRSLETSFWPTAQEIMREGRGAYNGCIQGF